MIQLWFDKGVGVSEDLVSVGCMFILRDMLIELVAVG